MHLQSAVLRDWKAYVQARFDFPNPTRGKNIILVGAENGFGKTSLFEAIILGLFGRDGLPLIARAPFGGSGEDRLSVSYKNFLESTLHARALEEGRSSCSVQLTFDNDDGEPVELRRVWSFSSNGAFNNPYMSEDVQVFEGTARRTRGPSGAYGQDRLDWYRDYVAKNFIPSPLAAFFMFDGERVDEFADKDMSAQVRTGIEGFLGIPVLRELAEDLRSYATSKKVPSKAGNGNLAFKTGVRFSGVEHHRRPASPSRSRTARRSRPTSCSSPSAAARSSEGLGYEEPGVATDRGFVLVDELLPHQRPDVYAVGDLDPDPAARPRRLRRGHPRRRADRRAQPAPDRLRRRPPRHLQRARGRVRRHHRGHGQGALRRRHGQDPRLRPRRQRQEQDPQDGRPGQAGRRRGRPRRRHPHGRQPRRRAHRRGPADRQLGGVRRRRRRR